MMRLLVLTPLIYLCFTNVKAVPLQERDIFDPLESFADSVFGISTGTTVSTEASPSQTNPASSLEPITLSDVPTTTALSRTTLSTVTGSESSTISNALKSTQTDASSSTKSNFSPSKSESLRTSTSTREPLRTTSSEIPPAPLNTANSVQPSSVSSTGSQSSPSSGNKISGGGIAVAVVLSVAVLSVVAYLIFKFCTPIQRRYLAWQERKMKARTYREALDGPNSYSTTQQRQQKGLGLGEVEKLKMKPRPFSFQFQFHNSQNQPPGTTRHEIKRKPLPWNTAVAGGDLRSGIGVALPMNQHQDQGR